MQMFSVELRLSRQECIDLWPLNCELLNISLGCVLTYGSSPVPSPADDVVLDRD